MHVVTLAWTGLQHTPSGADAVRLKTIHCWSKILIPSCFAARETDTKGNLRKQLDYFAVFIKSVRVWVCSLVGEHVVDKGEQRNASLLFGT